jgi:hypothetical protein
MSNGNLPAMPVPNTAYNGNGDAMRAEFPGLTKREYFAGLAAQGLLSNGKLAPCHQGPDGSITDETFARIAVMFADALLAELDRTAVNEATP